MKTTRHLLALLLSLLAPLAMHAQSYRPFNPANASAPYGITDIEPHLYSPTYGFTRFGNMMDRGTSFSSDDYLELGYTWLTEEAPLADAPPYDQTPVSENRLFLLKNDSDVIALPADADFSTPSEALGIQLDWQARFHTSQGDWRLMRVAHYPMALEQRGGNTLPSNTEKVVIMIHGWQPQGVTGGNDSDAYDDDSALDRLATLIDDELDAAQPADWKIVPYHWEKDADTREGLDATLVAVPTQTAEIARYHCYHLGERLLGITGGANGKLRSVHVIAHSAGSWAARSVAKYLLRAHKDGLTNSELKVQVTLLDPFIPEVAVGVNSVLSTAEMSQINDFYGATSETLFRLENYYSAAVISGNLGAIGTQEVFGWRGTDRDWNTRVDLKIGQTSNDDRYDPHSGPIIFYADTLEGIATLRGGTLPTHTGDGWFASMFNNEPVMYYTNPLVTVNAQTGGRTLSGLAYTRRYGPVSIPEVVMKYRWEVSANGTQFDPLDGADFSTSPTVALSAAVVNGPKKFYRLVAKTDAGYARTTSVAIGNNTPHVVNPPATVPAAPTNLSATAVSASQINLQWLDKSNNETGFRLQRRTATGTFADITTAASANSTAFSNTAGLSAGTTYFYRIRAFNGTGDSAYSGEASATTFAAAGTSYALTIASSNPASGVSVASMLGTGGYVGATTPTSRSFAAGTVVTVTCPRTLAGGQIFQKWQLDGVDYDFDDLANVTMDAAQTLTAVYSNVPPPSRTLQQLVITGPASVNEGLSAQYVATATFSDGGTQSVAAQWNLNFGAPAAISQAGVLNAASVTADSPATIEATFAAGGITKQAFFDITVRNAVAGETYRLTTGGSNGTVRRIPDLPVYTVGTRVVLQAIPADGFRFSNWSGAASGAETQISVTMDRDKAVNAVFVTGPPAGFVQVNIEPAGAVAAGAQWRIEDGPWQNSGATVQAHSNGDRTIFFKETPGWFSPFTRNAVVATGATTTLTVPYSQQTGLLQVSLQPQGAIAAGAQWRVDAGAWQNSATAVNVAPGLHLVEYKAVAGWAAPSGQNVSVSAGGTSHSIGSYGPALGQPAIASVSPPNGPLEGGTSVTIDGVNFAPDTTVKFGSTTATSVTVLSPGRIIATTPARASYGTVSVAVTSGGSSASIPNGFTYAVPRGMNLELMGQIGGSVTAVELAGSLAWIGEGSGLVGINISNPASPSPVGRIGLPGMVGDISIVSGNAYVANLESGIQVVNVSTPSAPSIRSFFDTPGDTRGVTVVGGRAYVADGAAGLQILDLSNPDALTRVGGTSTPGRALKVEVVTRPNGVFALIADGENGFQVVNVSDPANPVLGIKIATGTYAYSIAVSGNYAYVGGDIGDGVKIINVTDPAAPSLVGLMSAWGTSSAPAISVTGNRLYVGSNSGSAWAYDISNPTNPSNSIPFPPGNLQGVGQIAGAGSLVFAADSTGLKIADISNPSIPVMRGAYFPGLSIAHKLEASSNKAFVVDNQLGGGLRVIDAANPALPSIIASNSVPTTQAVNITLSNNRAYLCLGNGGVRIVDISNPNAPATMGTLLNSAYAFFDLAVAGNTAAYAGAQASTPQKGRMGLIDVTNGAAAALRGQLDIGPDNDPRYGQGIAIRGNLAFVANHDFGLRVVDISNVNAPALLGTVAAPLARSVALSDDGTKAFLACYDGLRVVDVQNPNAPTVLGTATTGAICMDVVQSGGLVFVAASTQGILVFDVSDPSNPVVVASYDTAWSASGVSVESDVVYACDSIGGLVLLRLKDTQSPQAIITNPVFAQTFTTIQGTITVGGTAADNKTVAQVFWSNDRGGSGAASGTTDWTISNITLIPGANVITVTAQDIDGNRTSDAITVTYQVPDTTAPIVQIGSPAAVESFKTSDSSISLSGSSADDVAITEVVWQNSRGDSGAATGLESWIVPAVSLSDGPNQITVTARDAAGNSASSSITIIKMPPDTIPPTVVIEFPTLDVNLHSTDAVVSLHGVAADENSEANVTWANSRGGSGEATGTRAWHINSIILQPGVNVITVTAEDAAGNVATDTLAVTFAPTGSDPARPALAVQTPAAKPLVTEQNHIACAGQASGGSAIAEVVVQVNGGPWLGATDTANWTADVVLTPGLNVIRFKAIDVTGRESLAVERSVTYRKLAPLALTTLGEGKAALLGNPLLTALEVGKLYTADAKPTKGWIFAGWEGAVVSNSKRVSFVMEEGATLTAVFVENPYDDIAATYRGLVRAEPLAHSTSGHALVTLTKSGAFTAQFIIGGKRLALRGAFDGTGSFLGRLKAGKAQTFDVLLALDPAAADAPITGLLSDGTATLALNAWPVTKFDRITGTPLAGAYTVAIEPTGDAGAPIGYGTGRMIVGKTGTVSVAARLANGTRTAFASAITAGNRAPIYDAMDAGESSFSAPLVFADKPDSDADAIAFWSSARVRTNAYPFDPFTSEPRLLAQRYTAPAKNERALTSLDATNGTATLTLDDGTAPLTQTLTLGTDNKLTFGSPLLSGFKMTLTPARGEFTGSLLLPANGKPATFSGVLLEKSGEGVGLLLTPDAEMAVMLRP